ncbi:MAG: hypothetical protein GC204_13435 [Chloroflexi bacterium]|nr:hypothetical protein [Chloroflexota bacterium]
MAILKSKNFRVGIMVITALVLVVVIGGFAMSRGYLMHFLIDNQTISRDDFYRNAFAPADQQIPMHCVQGDWTPGWLYIYEVHCFSTDAAAADYMRQHFGSS